MKLVLALGMTLLSAAAHAEIVTYTFSGTFGTPARFGPASTSTTPLLLDNIRAGDRFSGQFTFDTLGRAIDGFQWGGATFSYYKTLDFQFTGSEAFNNIVPAWNAPTFATSHEVDGPNISIGSLYTASGSPPKPPTYTNSFTVDAAAATGGNQISWSMYLSGESGSTPFQGNRIPAGFNDVVNPTFRIEVYGSQLDQWSKVDGTVQIQLASVSPVPEPSYALTLLAGLAGVGGAAARRRARHVAV